jgi:hypothetical protein
MLLVSRHVNCQANYAEIGTAAFEKIPRANRMQYSIILNNYIPQLSTDI